MGHFMYRNRFHIHPRRAVAALSVCAMAFGASTTGSGGRGPARASAPAGPAAPAMFTQYCFPCHGSTSPQAGISIEKLATNQTSLADGFQHWTRIAGALEQHAMPPAGMPQPEEKERA